MKAAQQLANAGWPRFATLPAASWLDRRSRSDDAEVLVDPSGSDRAFRSVYALPRQSTATHPRAECDGARDVRRRRAFGENCALKSFDERGFVFYTNYEGRKGGSSSLTPKRAVLLLGAHRHPGESRGTVTKVADEEAMPFRNSRPSQSDRRVGFEAERAAGNTHGVVERVAKYERVRGSRRSASTVLVRFSCLAGAHRILEGASEPTPRAAPLYESWIRLEN